jgi:peptidoglycan/LPS O-acetylase OafA/YrhL
MKKTMTTETVVELSPDEARHHPAPNNPSAMGVDGSKTYAVEDSNKKIVKVLLAVIAVILCAVLIVVDVIVANNGDDNYVPVPVPVSVPVAGNSLCLCDTSQRLELRREVHHGSFEVE